MRNPYQRKAASKNQNTAYDPLEIYRLFMETIVHQGHVIALYQDGWALCYANWTTFLCDVAE